MWFPTAKSKLYLNEALQLGSSGDEQDWEIELSNHVRVLEFLRFYQNCNGPENVRQTLMALILSSFEDGCSLNELSEESWKIASEVITRDFNFLKPVLSVWLPSGEDRFLISDMLNDLVVKIEDHSI